MEASHKRRVPSAPSRSPIIGLQSRVSFKLDHYPRPALAGQTPPGRHGGWREKPMVPQGGAWLGEVVIAHFDHQARPARMLAVRTFITEQMAVAA